MNKPRISRKFLQILMGTCGLALLTTACTTAPEQPPAAPPDATVTETPPDPASTPQSEDATRPVGEFSTNRYESETWPTPEDTRGIYPVEVRSAIHDGFERIVIEHAGTGTPSMLVHYTDAPVAPGSGFPIDIHQDAVLEIIWSGTASVDDIDETRLIDTTEPIINLDTSYAQSVVVFAPWEATSSYFIGVDEQRPFAVTILDDPVRLVVDFQTD